MNRYNVVQLSDTRAVKNKENVPHELRLHTVVLTDSSFRPYQVLFTGDRVLNLDLIRREIGVNDLVVDLRISGIGDDGNYERFAPLSDSQGCQTYIDESLMFKRDVHIGGKLGGYWICSAELKKQYKAAKCIHVSVPGNSDGFSVGFGSNSVNKSSYDNLSAYLDSNCTIGSMVFSSSARELVLIASGSPDEIHEDLVDLLKIDSFLYQEVVEYYFTTSKNPKDDVTISDILFEFGSDSILRYLTGIVASESTFFSDEIDFDGRSIFVAQWCLSFLMMRVAELALVKYPNICKITAKNIGRLAFSSLQSWIRVVGVENYKKYLELVSVNPHRYQIELQKFSLGFDQHSVASLMMSLNKFPHSYLSSIAEINAPFKGETEGYYSRMLYVLTSALVENKLIPSSLFDGIPGAHKAIMDGMDLKDEVGIAMSELIKLAPSLQCQKWRFGSDNISLTNKIDPSNFMHIP